MSHVDKEYLVFGYINRIERKHSIIIPNEIKSICLEYYLIKEYFTVHGANISLDETNMIATHSTYSPDTVYGNYLIDPTDATIARYKWKLVTNGPQFSVIYLGIDSSNKEYISNDFTNWSVNKHAWYAFSKSGITLRHDIQCGQLSDVTIQNNEIFNLVLDVEKKSFAIKSAEYEEAHEDIETVNVQYYLAITMASPDQKIQLIDFEIERSVASL